MSIFDLQTTDSLRQIIDKYSNLYSRKNNAKPIKYWYPLSQATYDSDEIIAALSVLCSFRTSMAEKTLEFERAFSDVCGSCDSVMVNSGSSADLLLSFLLSNPSNPLVPVGSEILVPAVTWSTHVWSIAMAGYKPVLVDIDPLSMNIDFNHIEKHVTSNTKALFLVHLLGNP